MPKRNGQPSRSHQNSRRLFEITELLRLISGTTRVQIILLLADGPLGVLELGRSLGLTATGTSIHLAHLRVGGVVESQRQGRFVNYQLTPTGERIARLVESLATKSRA